MTERQVAPYEKRYQIVMLLFAIFFTVDIFGFVFTISIASRDFTCEVSNSYFSTFFWPSNVINRKVLDAAIGGNLEACTTIAAVTWSAAVGASMLFTRIIFEIRFNERKNLLGLRGIFITLAIGLFLYLPFGGIGPSVIVDGYGYISINIHLPAVIAYCELLLFSFVAFFSFGECAAYALIYARSKHDARLLS